MQLRTGIDDRLLYDNRRPRSEWGFVPAGLSGLKRGKGSEKEFGPICNLDSLKSPFTILAYVGSKDVSPSWVRTNLRGSQRKRAMLVLTRKLMEKLFIGDDICVTVVRLEGGQVRLGIEAPREVAVVRAELVPERLQARVASGPRTHGDLVNSDVKPRPTSAHGIDSRRRGRFR
jgi:carbon storage regulator